MIPLETLRELYDYNYWARDRQLEPCRGLTAEQFQRPLGSSFTSLRDSLAPERTPVPGSRATAW